MKERYLDPDVHRPQAEEWIFTKHPNKMASRPFEEILALHLRSLLPNPHPQPSISLPWLSRAVKLLALTAVAASTDLISDPSLSSANPAALASHLDASIALLDACNAPLAEIECLHCGHLLLRFSLHLLAGEDHSLPLMPDCIRRAHKVIVEWEMLPRRAIARQDVDRPEGIVHRGGDGGPGDGDRRGSAQRQGEGGSGRSENFQLLLVGETLKEMEVAVSDGLRAGFPGEVEAVEAAVRAVVGVIDGEDDGEKAARLGRTVKELEGVMEELTEGMDPLSDAVNGLFRATMHTTDAALQSLGNGLKCDG